MVVAHLRGGREIAAALRDALPDLDSDQAAQLEIRLEEVVAIAARGTPARRPR